MSNSLKEQHKRVFNTAKQQCRLTLSFSTATTKRAFSIMNIVKIRHCNKIKDEFQTDSLMLYVEREISAKFSINSIIYDFFIIFLNKIIITTFITQENKN